VPDDARSGDAVVVRTAPADEARWSGEAQAIGKITLGKQSIQWPGKLEDGPIGLTLTIDAEDTAARKERVRGLVDDIFKKKS
jgi:hypothetical protein